MNVVYGLLNRVTQITGTVNKVYGVFSAIGTIYNTIFDNSNGVNIVLDTGEFLLTLKLDNEKYSLTTSISSVEVSVYADLANNTYGAKILLTENSVLKYSVKENELVIAYNIPNVSATQIQFVRKNGQVNGYIYESIIAGSISTSALLTVKDGCTIVVGNKGDFLPTSEGVNCEIYENTNGRFVGNEVYEKLNDSTSYDTLWYNLYDVGGIDSIKKVDKQNVSNPDTVYINGNDTESIHSGTVAKYEGKVIGDMSRPCDIEFKAVYSYTFNAETGKYESVQYEIPLMFIQEKCTEKFCEYYKKINSKLIADEVTLNVTAKDEEIIKFGYHTLVEDYKKIKELVTGEAIIEYCKA